MEADVHHIFKTLAVTGALLFSDQSGPRAVTSRLPAQAGGAPPQAGGRLPNDINPDTRSRLPPIDRASLTPEARTAYDAAAMTSPTGRPEGVEAIRLHRSGVDVRWDW